ncbi:hypothetical protein C8Q74DRAFT_1435243 [Fomes fomentarius]|nr:hypothetical protein C8Q74DRAFT_1435243 [Fomes fomentarius]
MCSSSLALYYLISTNVGSTTTLQQLKLLGTDVESLLPDGHWRHRFQRPDGRSPPQTHADQTCSILVSPPVASLLPFSPFSHVYRCTTGSTLHR